MLVPHVIVEELILLLAKIIISAILEEKTANELNIMSSSIKYIKNYIADMSVNIDEQLIENVILYASRYNTLRSDESTDMCNDANSLTFVRHEPDQTTGEDLPFCQHLRTNTAGEAILEVLDIFRRLVILSGTVARRKHGRARAATETKEGLWSR
ncbi:Zinc finger BED domain-containing protein 5 [Eumeta japonica]|uniref:Zinc finger BED domain-containing protein 5 n=1 Tax=Eumeta variegata TaxID=151549 RepID=A0A4C1XNR4_EUMVA|nr:Zinc finger BED domain-containing protein 5 [Eumeta japonica]